MKSRNRAQQICRGDNRAAGRDPGQPCDRGSVMAGTAVAGATRSPASSPPACAWPPQISADTENVALPDSAASVSAQWFTFEGDLRVMLSGRYPDARYA